MKVNLEKELIRQNRTIAAPKELLLINEYDRLGNDVAIDTTLGKIGINTAVKAGKSLKEKVNGLKEQTEKFNQERVFHVSQIEGICKKYYLKFLPSSMYKGSIDIGLSAKISQFEIAYSENCNQANCFIAAPPTSFDLEEKPKDPLLFFKINEEYFYLIHKWGRDLSVMRRSLTLLSRTGFCILLLWIAAIGVAVPLYLLQTADDAKAMSVVIPSVIALFVTIPFGVEQGAFVRKNVWNSKFKN